MAERKERTSFYSKYSFYEPTRDFKDYFLNKCEQEFNENRYNTMKNLMRKVGKWESRYKKDVYDFNLEQLKGMLKEFNSTSEMSLMSQKSNLEYYLWFAKKENMGSSNIVSTISLTYSEIKEFVNPIGSEQRYITRDELYDLVIPSYDEKDELVSGLLNAVDQAMLLLPFESIVGKANEEMSGIKWRNIDFENCIVKLDDREVEINTELAIILDKANNQTEYLLNNGATTEKARRTKAEIVDKYDSEYLFRPVAYKNDGSGRLSGNAMQRRILTNCKQWLNRPYLTVSSIYTSGMIDRAIRYTLDKLNGEQMKLVEFSNWVKNNNEKANVQDTYSLYTKMLQDTLSNE